MRGIVPGSLCLALASCVQQAYDDAKALSVTEATSSSGQSSTGSTGWLDPDPTGVIQTVSGDGDETDAMTSDPPEPSDETSTGAPVNEPPEILSVAFSPTEFTDNAGPATLELAASPDVVEVEVASEGVILATQPFAGFAFTFEVTSQATCHGIKTFMITVRDAEGLADSDTASLYCQLPASGSEEYTTTLPGAQGSTATALALLPDDGVLVAGTRDGRMALWQLDAAGQIEATKTIAEWSNDPKYVLLTSYATAVARDATGAIFVGGVVKDGPDLRRYVVKLNGSMMRIWEDAGVKDGEEIAGLAVATDGTAVAAGKIRTSAPNLPAAFDAGIWGYGPEGLIWTDAFARPKSDPKPDGLNEYSERAHAVLGLPDGSVLVTGEREYTDGANNDYVRAWWQRYASDKTRLGEPWTSPGKPFAHDAARGVVLTYNGWALAGWGQHVKPNGATQVLVHRFDKTAKLIASAPIVSAVAAQAEGIAQDREKKLVLAGYRTDMGVWNAWIFAAIGLDKPPVWEQIELLAAAKAVACGPWGKCTWVGTSLQGKSTAIVSTRNP